MKKRSAPARNDLAAEHRTLDAADLDAVAGGDFLSAILGYPQRPQPGTSYPIHSGDQPTPSPSQHSLFASYFQDRLPAVWSGIRSTFNSAVEKAPSFFTPSQQLPPTRGLSDGDDPLDRAVTGEELNAGNAPVAAVEEGIDQVGDEEGATDYRGAPYADLGPGATAPNEDERDYADAEIEELPEVPIDTA